MTKYFIALCLCLAGCRFPAPKIVPDTSRPSVMEETIQHHMQVDSGPSYFWVLWYVPIVAVVLGFTWKTFFRKEADGPKEGS